MTALVYSITPPRPLCRLSVSSLAQERQQNLITHSLTAPQTKCIFTKVNFVYWFRFHLYLFLIVLGSNKVNLGYVSLTATGLKLSQMHIATRVWGILDIDKHKNIRQKKHFIELCHVLAWLVDEYLLMVICLIITNPSLGLGLVRFLSFQPLLACYFCP